MLSRKKICIFNFVGFEECFPRCLGRLYNSFVASMRVAQQDRWIIILYQKHFHLGITRSATTDCVTWKATVDACNRIDYATHDWHRSVQRFSNFCMLRHTNTFWIWLRHTYFMKSKTNFSQTLQRELRITRFSQNTKTFMAHFSGKPVCRGTQFGKHWLVDKLAIFIQRYCAFFDSVKSLSFHRCKIFLLGV